MLVYPTFLNSGVLLGPAFAAHSLAQALSSATSREEVFEAVLNATEVEKGVRPSVSFPLFHRAFPTHNYHQVW